jgi:hypothetical protein
MKRFVAVCSALALCAAGMAAAREAQPPKAGKNGAAATKGKAAARVRSDADALAEAYDRVLENYKRNRRRAAAAPAKKTVVEKASAARSKPEANGAKSAAAKAAEAKKQAEALGRAQDRAVVNYRRNKGLPVAEAPVRRNEKLACFTGTEDRHARIGVELVNEQVAYFAYYSKWKPRTCSIEARRDGPYSRWDVKGAISTITLVDQKGVMQIERKGRGYRFAFHDVDRERYCGMDGKINGSLIVTRGSSKCVLQGVMDGHGN